MRWTGSPPGILATRVRASRTRSSASGPAHPPAPTSPCCAPRRRPWPTSASTPPPRRCGSSYATIPASWRWPVTDDGQGFDPATVRGGYGLLGMRTRASSFGGTCTVRSAPGQGTTVRVELPPAPAAQTARSLQPVLDFSSTPDNSAGGTGSMTVHILIVDDHPVVRFGLRGMLEADRGPAGRRRGRLRRRGDRPCLHDAPGCGPDGPADAGYRWRHRNGAHPSAGTPRFACSC